MNVSGGASSGGGGNYTRVKTKNSKNGNAATSPTAEFEVNENLLILA